MTRVKFKAGFTLSELLVGLTLIGLIATFALPKILTAYSGSLANAKVHKAIQAVLDGYEKWRLENGSAATTTTPADIMSMVKHNGQITDGRWVDWNPGRGGYQCVPTYADGLHGVCYAMPDGEVVYFIEAYNAARNPGNSGYQNNLVWVGVDPDGNSWDSSTWWKPTGDTGAGIIFLLDTTGKFVTWSTIPDYYKP